MEHNILFSGKTDIGKIRHNNEDTFIAQYIWDKNHILLAAIDGMGGEDGGEVAAEIARETIIRHFTDPNNNTNIDLIKNAVADANNEIVRQKRLLPQFAHMGCVATLGIIDIVENTLTIAHVGDSRLYRYSHGELVKLTHDHSMVGEMEECGKLTEDQAMHHPQRAIIDRCLGSEIQMADDPFFIEVGIFPLIAGEMFLFCSDGLSDVLTSSQIKECIECDLSPEDICNLLIDTANEMGGKDNITVVVAKINSQEPFLSEQKQPEISAGDLKDNETSEKRIGEEENKKTISSIILGILGLICIALGFVLGCLYTKNMQNEDKTISSETSDIIVDSAIDSLGIIDNSIDYEVDHTDKHIKPNE